MEPFIVIVAGSQGFNDLEFATERLDYYLKNKTNLIIRQGECKSSPDLLARQYAELRGITLQSFPADWTQGRGAGWKRNWEMARGNVQFPGKANALIAFNANTVGTNNMIEICQKLDIPVREVPVTVDLKDLPKRNRKASILLPSTIEFAEKTPLRTRKPKAIVIEGEELIAKPKTKHKKKPQPSGDNAWKARYQAAHEEHFKRETPMAHRDGHYLDPIYPRVRESNGMQTAIVNYLNWKGHRAKRINNMGRQVDGIDTTESGAHITVKKWIQSAAGKGQADISATIHGRSCQLEVKAGNDKPSPGQLKEQAKERKAGGVYEFIHSIEQFFQWYDNFGSQSQMF